ncbi:glycosyl transferase family 25 [Rhodovulum iodosum]|uniref:Glycosyl transferase family 25 n=1 Tax=Rhodovulum iodosum TaxID=68291 RepID=A0ABV3XXC1_9RHOB|nr:glycosyltransferase family 25 protein [Rhodovulum robiginosum]RSK38355.1 glycosyltransferase family 25 protein [Rhodovulum robiginosum]
MANSIEIVVISLEKAVERRQMILGQFSGLTIPWSFFDAQTCLANPALSYDEPHIRRKFGRTLSVPELAVWSSHFSVIQRFLEQGQTDYLLVFEDDVIFDASFPLRAVVDLCEAKAIHYIRLFGMYYADAVRLGFFYDRSIIRYKSSPAGAQAYVISKEGARRLVASMTSVEATVDLEMDHFWKTGLPIYAVFPFPVIERFSSTSIPMHQPGGLSGGEKRAWLYNRARRRLSKMRENRRLLDADAEFRKSSMVFKQIQDADLQES